MSLSSLRDFKQFALLFMGTTKAFTCFGHNLLLGHMEIGPKFRHISVFHSQDDERVFLSCVELRQPQLNKHLANVSRISFRVYLKVVSTHSSVENLTI